MVPVRSNWYNDQKNTVGNYEFTLTPSAMFAPGGPVLPCDNRAKLIHYLEKLIQTQDETQQNVHTPASEEHNEIFKIAIVDGMDLVHKWPRNTTHLVEWKISADSSKEISSFWQLVFDTYKTESLKQKTRAKQQHGKDPIYYEIADNTRINLRQIARSLSPEKQRQISLFTWLKLYSKLNANSPRLFILSASGCTKSNLDKPF